MYGLRMTPCTTGRSFRRGWFNETCICSGGNRGREGRLGPGLSFYRPRPLRAAAPNEIALPTLAGNKLPQADPWCDYHVDSSTTVLKARDCPLSYSPPHGRDDITLLPSEVP